MEPTDPMEINRDARADCRGDLVRQQADQLDDEGRPVDRARLAIRSDDARPGIRATGRLLLVRDDRAELHGVLLPQDVLLVAGKHAVVRVPEIDGAFSTPVRVREP